MYTYMVQWRLHTGLCLCLCLCCLMKTGLSKDIRCRVWPYFSKLANHQIRHQETYKMGCQPGDCMLLVTAIFLRGLCGYVCVNILTTPLPRVKFKIYNWKHGQSWKGVPVWHSTLEECHNRRVICTEWSSLRVGSTSEGSQLRRGACTR